MTTLRCTRRRNRSSVKKIGWLVIMLAFAVFPALTSASNWWGGYHWARVGNPFTLKLGDNVSSAWDAYLGVASFDWSLSSVLDTTIVAGTTTPRRCRPASGRVEICNHTYGNNGWLGVAQIWVNSSSHITQGTVKLNDTYFNTATYNTPGWRHLVMCQEIGHTFGLDHQDENSGNTNLGTCMDYTNNPYGPPSNEHPNQHDYDQLEIIYAHLDSSTTVGQAVQSPAAATNNRRDGHAQWGELIRSTNNGRTGLYKLNLGDGHKVFTFVVWADGEGS